MTIDITHLRTLLAAATPRPWLATNPGDDGIVYTVNFRHNDKEFRVCKLAAAGARGDADATLIAAAINALPGLLDELERYREALGPFAEDKRWYCNYDGDAVMRDADMHRGRARKALGEPSGNSGELNDSESPNSSGDGR